MDLDLSKIKKIHFVGIGGIGVSALARMMLSRGKSVSGSDTSESPVTFGLEKEGIPVFIGHKIENLPESVDLVVYSLAISPENPELVEAKKRGVPSLHYPQLLGLVSRQFYTIAITGTHGKTTTTAMLGTALKVAGFDPTVVVGSLLNEEGTNFIGGKSKYLVVESCEYRRGFLNLNPKMVIITNIDLDHLDYYKDLEDIKSAFREFILKIPADGFLIANTQDPVIKDILDGLKCKIIDSGRFLEYAGKLNLKVFGEHNVLNASSTLAVCDALGAETGLCQKGVEGFKGTWRRLEFKVKMPHGALVYSDYGHNPTEIRVTIDALKNKFPDKNIVVIFQPHLYSRTKLLIDEFSSCFNMADSVIITDIYASRETLDPEISSQVLVDSVNANGKKAEYIDGFDEIERKISLMDNPNTIFLFQGAGDIYKVPDRLQNML